MRISLVRVWHLEKVVKSKMETGLCVYVCIREGREKGRGLLG